MNDDPKYPQIVEVLAEIQLPKAERKRSRKSLEQITSGLPTIRTSERVADRASRSICECHPHRARPRIHWRLDWR
jgi:hypothetical protein